MKRLNLIAALSAAAVLLAACGGASEKDLLDQARAALAKDDRAAALIHIKGAIQKNSDSGEARYLLGKTLLDGGEAVTAALELRKARDLRYSEAKVVPPLARALLLAGDKGKVIGEFANTILDDPEAQADLKTTLAQALAASGDIELAKAALAAGLQAQPNHGGAKLLSAQIKAGEGDTTGALATVGEVLSSNPKDAQALLVKGELLAVGGKDRKAAIEAWKAALEIQPKLVAAHRAIITTLLGSQDLEAASTQLDAMKKALPNHLETRFFMAQVAFLRKDFAAVREQVEQILKVRPDDPLTLQLAGLADFQQKNYTSAENYLARALKAAPGLGLARETLAQIYLRSAQPNKAVELLAPMAAASGVEARIVALTAEAYRQAGNTKRADELFAKAGQSDTTNAGVRAVVALNQAAKGDEKALGELERLAAADTAGNKTDLALIRTRLSKNDLDGALKDIDRLAKKQPDKPLAWHLRGRVLMLKKDDKGATAAFEKALSLDKTFTPSAASLAAMDLRDGKPDAAKKRLDDVLAADPKNLQARIALADLKSRTGGSKDDVAQILGQAVKDHPGEARPRVMLIKWLISQGDGKGALTVARDASAAMPSNLDVMDALGTAQIAGGDQQQAVSTFKKLASLQPTQVLPQMRLADAYTASKDSEGAASALRKALQLKPDLLPAQRALAAMAMADRRPQEALQLARDIQKQRPTEAMGYLLEGDAEASRKNWDAALAAWRNGLAKAKSGELAARVVRGLRETGKTAEADKFSAGWMAENPKDAFFQYQMGDMAIEKKQWEQAENAYRSVLKIAPDNALAANNVAWLLLQQSKPGALEYAQKANAALPDRPPLMDTLALALLAEGQAPKALEVQKRAVERAPDAPGLRLTLARIYLKTGAKDQAKTELEKLAKLGDKFPQQAEVGELLKTL